jgi:hypothetical protein
MATSMRFEDRLEGASNFSPWRERMELLLGVNDVWEITSTTVATPIDATHMASHNKKDMNARRLILDGVKDHSSLTSPRRRQQERCETLLSSHIKVTIRSEKWC